MVRKNFSVINFGISFSHEADLALLGVDDPDFFNVVKPLELGDLPKVQEDVIVYGFPGEMYSALPRA